MEKFEDFKQLLVNNRSVRRFDNSKKINRDILYQLVELIRYCASGRNAQPLRYRIVDDEKECESVYPSLAWAGYYQNWDGPEQAQRPVAYLIQCLDTTLGNDCLCDDGLQLQAITLAAQTMGISACIIKAFNAPKISEVLNIDNRYKPRYVLALGYPNEIVKIVDIKDNDFKYFRDEEDNQCVPKRPLSELIIK